MNLRRWIRSAYEAVLFIAGCVVVAFLTFVIVGGLMTTEPLVTGFWRILVAAVARDRLQLLKVASTAILAIAAAAWPKPTSYGLKTAATSSARWWSRGESRSSVSASSSRERLAVFATSTTGRR